MTNTAGIKRKVRENPRISGLRVCLKDESGKGWGVELNSEYEAGSL